MPVIAVIIGSYLKLKNSQYVVKFAVRLHGRIVKEALSGEPSLRR
jgi:hypothetical protein